ncbi:MAG: UTP--glucose-1-phosphate uridylyltransferase [Verrucomicrobiales bacterium]
MPQTPDTTDPAFLPFRRKMQAAGLPEAAIRAFAGSYGALRRGATGLICESDIEPASGLANASSLSTAPRPELLSASVVIKLNGGLGTSMGLEKAKSLLPVRGDDTFLDLIARQLLRLRERSGGGAPRILLMNSFSTSADTRAHLAAHQPALGDPADLELMQNRVPKVLAADLTPLHWPSQTDLEWCPPGHGDIYACLLGSGLLDRLLADGVRYAFVSNADNLGATLDGRLLAWFAESDQSFAMEVTRRTAADRKGGHLARRCDDGRLLLRESAQCPKDDEQAFQDIDRHQFFNTNNLWIRLDRLREELERHDGLIPLPIIINKKTADPRDPASPAVLQLETAMGAAIEAFADAGAIEVPRTRFAPVKTTADLLAVRSDAYELTPDFRLELHPSRAGQPPRIALDDSCKLVDGLDATFPQGPPSLRGCRSLTMKGRFEVEAGVVFRGDVAMINEAADAKRVGAGVYGDD